MLNRIDNIAASATPASADIFARYAYLGAGTIVRVSRPSQADALSLNYDPANNHTYSGWDRFGRVVNQQWTTAGGTIDQYTYTYDIAGNRTTRTNALNSTLTETYTYDELSRLIDTDRGEGQQQVSFESWNLDQLGNWTTFCGPIQTTQTRTHNEANEITSVSGGGPQPAYDAAGNTVHFADARDSTPDSSTLGMNAVYDAWNRMTKVYADDGATAGQLDAGDSPIAVYEYDGQRRRVEKTVYDGGEAVATTGTYFNENWQAMEERATDLTVESGGESTTQYLWDIRYIDAPIVRLLDANADGDLADAGDSVVHYVTDGNFNVTALVDGPTGAAVERYAYEGYGNQTVLEADWTLDADNASDVGNTRGFSGAIRDAETGLIDMRHRPQHPTLGRFLSQDPLQDGMHLYEYCGGRPGAARDPLGLSVGVESVIKSIICQDLLPHWSITKQTWFPRASNGEARRKQEVFDIAAAGLGYRVAQSITHESLKEGLSWAAKFAGLFAGYSGMTVLAEAFNGTDMAMALWDKDYGTVAAEAYILAGQKGVGSVVKWGWDFLRNGQDAFNDKRLGNLYADYLKRVARQEVTEEFVKVAEPVLSQAVKDEIVKMIKLSAPPDSTVTLDGVQLNWPTGPHCETKIDSIHLTWQFGRDTMVVNMGGTYYDSRNCTCYVWALQDVFTKMAGDVSSGPRLALQKVK